MERLEIARKREENEIDFARIVAFSDGVFSIAITLLVLDLTIKDGLPDGQVAHELWAERDKLLAYAISFAVIGRFWLIHHEFFSKVKAFDSRLIRLNMLYLGWIVLIPFSTTVIGEYAGTPAGVTVYALNLIGVVLIGQWMTTDARRDGLAEDDGKTEREHWTRACVICAVFLLSIGASFIYAPLGPYCWLLLFVEGRFEVSERLSGARSS